MHRDAHLPRRGGHFLSGRRAGRVCDLIGCRPDWNVLWKSVSAMVSRTLRFHGPTLWPYYLDPLMDLAPEGFLSNVSVKNLSKGYDPGRSLARSARSSVSAAEMSLGLIYTAVYTGLVIACIWLTQQPHKHTHTLSWSRAEAEQDYTTTPCRQTMWGRKDKNCFFNWFNSHLTAKRRGNVWKEQTPTVGDH